MFSFAVQWGEWSRSVMWGPIEEARHQLVEFTTSSFVECVLWEMCRGGVSGKAVWGDAFRKSLRVG